MKAGGGSSKAMGTVVTVCPSRQDDVSRSYGLERYVYAFNFVGSLEEVMDGLLFWGLVTLFGSVLFYFYRKVCYPIS